MSSEGRAHGGGGAALTAADGGGDGPSAGRRSVAAIAVACRLAGPASGPRRSGLAALHGASRHARPPAPLSPKPLLVALLQSEIPTHIGAKQQLIRLLKRWAREQSEWTIVLQPDHPWSSTPTLDTDNTSDPTNVVEAAPEQMLGLLRQCTACLSVSSPWSLVAMMGGRIPVVVGDYGIQAEQQTTSFFGCGAMHRLRDLEGLHKLQELPLVNQGWLEAMGGSIQNGPARLLVALDNLGQGSTAP